MENIASRYIKAKKVAQVDPTVTPEASITPSEDKVASVANAALDAFWEVVIRSYNKQDYGDLDPEVAMNLDEAVGKAVEQWASTVQ